MSSFYVAIDINTEGSFTNTSIGHTNDGHMRLITGRPDYDGTPTYPVWEDDSNNTEVWYEGIILLDGIGNASSSINITVSGEYGTLSGFSFALENSQKIWNILTGNDVYLINKPVQVYVVIDDKFYYAWAGVIVNDPYTSTEFTCECQSNYRKIHKNLPPKTISSVLFPKAKNEEMGKALPICLGDQNFARLYSIDNKTEKQKIDFNNVSRNQDNLLSENSFLQIQRDKMLFAVPAVDYNEDPGSGNPYVDLKVVYERTNKDIYKNMFLYPVYGENAPLNKVYRIIGNDTYTSGYVRVYLEESFDEVSQSTFTSNYIYSSGLDEKTWLFSIISGKDINIISNNSVSEYKKSLGKDLILNAYNYEKNSFENTNQLINYVGTFQNRDEIGLVNSLLNGGSLTIPVPLKTRFLQSLSDGSIKNDQDAFNIKNATDFDRSTKTDDLLAANNFTLTLTTGSYNIGSPYELNSIRFDFDVSDTLQFENCANIYLGFDIQFLITDLALSSFGVGIGYKITPIDNYEIEFNYSQTSSTQYEFTDTASNSTMTLNCNFLPNSYYRSTGADNSENSVFHKYQSGTAVKSLIGLNSDIVSMLQKGSIKYLRICLRLHPVDQNITFDKFYIKQAGLFAKTTIDTLKGNSYVKIDGGEEYSSGVKTNSVYNAFRHILENYDEISSSDIDYDNLATYRSWNADIATGWDLGRQINETKNSFEYLDELAKQSMVGIVPTRDNKLKLSAFNEYQYEPDASPAIDDTVETFTEATNILRDSITEIQKTPFEDTYNEFFLKYGWNLATQNYEREITITKVDENSFPDLLEPNSGSNTALSDSYTLVRLQLFSNGEGVAVFPSDISGQLSEGSVVSCYSGKYFLHFGRIRSFSADNKTVSIVDAVRWSEDTAYAKNTYSNIVFIKHPDNTIPKWITFCQGFNAYADAKNFWEVCHASYLQSGIVKRCPENYTSLPWYIDRAEYNSDKEFYRGTKATTSPYLLFKNLVEWTTYRKSMISFSIPMTATYIVRDLLDFCLFNDAIYSNDANIAGWIIEKNLDFNNRKIDITMLFRPIVDELVNVVIETGANAIQIEETGSTTDIIEED